MSWNRRSARDDVARVVAAELPASDDEPLIAFNAEDDFTLRDAFEGVQIFGGTGSGKTSGSGWTLARALLTAGFGGLVLTAKPDECDHWVELCASVRRKSDLRVLEPGGPFRFNFLAYEAASGSSATTYDLVSLLMDAMGGGSAKKSRDPYWDDTQRQLLTNAIDLLRISSRQIDLTAIAQVIRGAPQSPEEARSVLARVATDDERGRFRLLRELIQVGAQRAEADPSLRADMNETIEYWLSEFPSLDHRTSTSIVSSFSSKATGLLRSPFRDLLLSDTTRDSLGRPDVAPDASFAGKIVVLNVPVKQFGETGRLAQVLYKTTWQRATERRQDRRIPVFLWADESQYFFSKYDMAFQQTARSSRCATVYLTQSIPNYLAALGGEDESRSVVDAFLTNLQTKIFHFNSDPVTNEWTQRVFGETRGSGRSLSGKQHGMQDVMVPVVASLSMTRLRKGGPQNDRRVEAFVFAGGKHWSGGPERHPRQGSPWHCGERSEGALMTAFEQPER